VPLADALVELGMRAAEVLGLALERT